MRCPHCLELNSSGNRYCTGCGKDLFVQSTPEKPKPQVRQVEEIVKESVAKKPVRSTNLASQLNDKPAENLFTQPRKVPVSDTLVASRGQRLNAFIIDSVLGAIAVAPMMKDIISNGDVSIEKAVGFLISLALIFLLFIVQMVFLVTSGQTIGKKLIGIKIVDNKTGELPDGVRLIVLRTIVPHIASQFTGGLFGFVDVLVILGAEQRCLHDQIANTKVVIAR